MYALQIIITDAGRAALVNAKNDGTNAVRIVSAGVSATAFAPSKATTAIPGEIKRILTLSGAVVAADTIHLIVRDESADAYSVRTLGLYLADGTLFAVYSQAGVLLEKSAQAMMLLQVDTAFVDIDATPITFGNADFLNPPATTDTAGVVQRATDAEALALANALKYLTPKQIGQIFTAANVLTRLLTVDGAGSGLDADLLDGRQGAEFALLAGANFNGTISAPSLGAQSLGAGRAVLVTGDATHVGYLSFQDAAGREVAYIGNQGLPNSSTLYSNPTGHNFMGGPVSATGFTRAGSIVWDAANDGAGSGLDADLLDGRQAAEFALLTGAAFSGALSSFGITSTAAAVGAGGWEMAGTFLAAANPMFRLGSNISGKYASIGNDPYGRFQFFVNGSTGVVGTNAFNIEPNGVVSVVSELRVGGNQAWHAGNDGSGSGLDADLLDGRQAAEFALLAGAAFGGAVSAPSLSITGTAGAPNYLLLNNAANAGGKVWRVGDTGTAPSGYFSVTNITDNVSPLTITPLGAVTINYSLNVGNTLTQAGNPVWHAGNDGSGSGLDADLLDGRHASDFALLSGAGFSGPISAPTVGTAGAGTGRAVLVTGDAARVGYLSLQDAAGREVAYIGNQGMANSETLYSNATGHNFLGGGVSGTAFFRAGNRVWDVGNDGSGSGLDADLLDGLHAGQFWQPSNDGAGSGLDADLLDGRHAADFVLRSEATFGSNANGYWERRPNGVIEQWGTLAQQLNDSTFSILFPQEFSDEASVSVSALPLNISASGSMDLVVQRVSKTTKGAMFVVQYIGTTNLHFIDGIDWRAIGR